MTDTNRPSLYTNEPYTPVTSIGQSETARLGTLGCLRSDNTVDITVIQITPYSKITVYFITTGFGARSVKITSPAVF